MISIWKKDKSSIMSLQDFIIREINITINSISKKTFNILPISAIRCFYFQRYEKKEREKIENIISFKYATIYEKEIIP